eukprot:g12879.t1
MSSRLLEKMQLHGTRSIRELVNMCQAPIGLEHQGMRMPDSVTAKETHAEAEQVRRKAAATLKKKPVEEDPEWIADKQWAEQEDLLEFNFRGQVYVRVSAHIANGEWIPRELYEEKYERRAKSGQLRRHYTQPQREAVRTTNITAKLAEGMQTDPDPKRREAIIEEVRLRRYNEEARKAIQTMGGFCPEMVSRDFEKYYYLFGVEDTDLNVADFFNPDTRMWEAVRSLVLNMGNAHTPRDVIEKCKERIRLVLQQEQDKNLRRKDMQRLLGVANYIAQHTTRAGAEFLRAVYPWAGEDQFGELKHGEDATMDFRSLDFAMVSGDFNFRLLPRNEDFFEGVEAVGQEHSAAVPRVLPLRADFTGDVSGKTVFCSKIQGSLGRLDSDSTIVEGEFPRWLPPDLYVAHVLGKMRKHGSGKNYFSIFPAQHQHADHVKRRTRSSGEGRSDGEEDDELQVVAGGEAEDQVARDQASDQARSNREPSSCANFPARKNPLIKREARRSPRSQAYAFHLSEQQGAFYVPCKRGSEQQTSSGQVEKAALRFFDRRNLMRNLQNDELTITWRGRGGGTALSLLQEPPIEFLPSYKLKTKDYYTAVGRPPGATHNIHLSGVWEALLRCSRPLHFQERGWECWKREY